MLVYPHTVLLLHLCVCGWDGIYPGNPLSSVKELQNVHSHHIEVPCNQKKKGWGELRHLKSSPEKSATEDCRLVEVSLKHTQVVKNHSSIE